MTLVFLLEESVAVGFDFTWEQPEAIGHKVEVAKPILQERHA